MLLPEPVVLCTPVPRRLFARGLRKNPAAVHYCTCVLEACPTDVTLATDTVAGAAAPGHSSAAARWPVGGAARRLSLHGSGRREQQRPTPRPAVSPPSRHTRALITMSHHHGLRPRRGSGGDPQRTCEQRQASGKRAAERTKLRPVPPALDDSRSRGRPRAVGYDVEAAHQVLCHARDAQSRWCVGAQGGHAGRATPAAAAACWRPTSRMNNLPSARHSTCTTSSVET